MSDWNTFKTSFAQQCNDAEAAMSEIKHTPGPWEVDDTGYRAASGGLCVMAGDWCITVVAGDNDKPQSENARLIAAAPELLEALIAVVSVADRATVEFDKARAAISKATGEIK